MHFGYILILKKYLFCTLQGSKETKNPTKT